MRDNIHYIDENLVVYPAGHNTVVYNTDTRTQKFIQGSEDTEGITAITLSPSRRYVAVAERAERAMVNVYDLHTLKRRKNLLTTDCASKEYVSLSFSADNKFLLTQGGAPDYTLVLWSWEKAKPVASIKTGGDGVPNPVYQCSFNPVDQTVACVTGDKVLNFYRLAEASCGGPREVAAGGGGWSCGGGVLCWGVSINARGSPCSCSYNCGRLLARCRTTYTYSSALIRPPHPL